ncbi:ALP1-like protein [Tanacetum coccineum]
MLGSIDCMHWEWRNCPKAWHGQFARGDKKYPTIMLEAVASYDLWIWHAFFGVAGANNDLTVLNNSPLFDDLLDDIAPVAPFECNGVTFEKGYYLADDIYPQWSSFVKSFTVANSEKNALFKRKQESARKDVERAFGVLQGLVAQDNITGITYVIPRKRKITEKGDEEAASEVASPEMIPWGLLLDLRKELELRKRLETNENDGETRVCWEVAQCMIKETIRNCKRTKELPRGWKYNPANLSNLVAIDPRIVKKNHPKRSQTGLESHDHVKRPRCCAPWDPNHKFPKTTNVPLNDEEKIIWKEFKEFDKDNPGLSGISSLTLDKDGKPIDVANPIVSLISSYAVAAFNEAIEKGLFVLCMERGFLSQKESGGGRGVKEKKQGDGGAHSLGNGGTLSGTGAAQSSNTVDDIGKDNDGLSLSPTKVTLGISAVNKEDTLPDENDRLTPSKSIANPNNGTSYTNLFTGGPSRKAMNFRTLFTPTRNEVDVVVPVESIRAISERIFSFQFNSMDCLDAMLENGLWFIHNNPLILKNLEVKEDVGNVLVWVKLYGVPLTAFSEDGLSAIVSKLGTPLMLDSYKSDMCIQSWGMSRYARTLIKVLSDMG